MIDIWAEKELRNLIRMKNAGKILVTIRFNFISKDNFLGINCPATVHLKKHILVMEMIADEHGPALKLKDTIFNTADLCIAYDQVVEVNRWFNLYAG